MGLTLAFLGALAADLAGGDETRRFTRPISTGVLLIESGVIAGLASWSGDALAMVGGLVGGFL